MGLAALAGYIDALGFLSLGGVFVSFMSGNSTRFAVGVTDNINWKIGLMPVVTIVLFVVGVMCGRIIRHFRKTLPSTSILVFMSCALAAAGFLYEFHTNAVAISLMVLAMGAANNVFVKEGEVSIGVTYMTGTLVRLGQRLAGKLLGEKENNWVPYLLLWMGLIGGAILGSLSYQYYGLHSIWAGCMICLVLTLASARIESRDS